MHGPSTGNLEVDDKPHDLHDLVPSLPPSAPTAPCADKSKGCIVSKLEDGEEINQLIPSDPPPVQDTHTSGSHTLKPPAKLLAPPRFAWKMPPQFTQEIVHEQSLEEEGHCCDTAWIESARCAK